VVTVRIDAAPETNIEVAPGAFAWLKEEYGPDAWEWSICDDYRAGALSGCRHALANIETIATCSACHVVISRIHAHPAHSSAKDVAFAACQATWQALGVKGLVDPELV